MEGGDSLAEEDMRDTARPEEGCGGFMQPLEWGYWGCIQAWRGVNPL